MSAGCYRVLRIEPWPEPTSVAVGATYDATVAETNKPAPPGAADGTFAIGAAAVFAWLLAAVRLFKQLAEQTRFIDGRRGATRGSTRRQRSFHRDAEAMRGMLRRIWNEQN